MSVSMLDRGLSESSFRLVLHGDELRASATTFTDRASMLDTVTATARHDVTRLPSWQGSEAEEYRSWINALAGRANAISGSFTAIAKALKDLAKAYDDAETAMAEGLSAFRKADGEYDDNDTLLSDASRQRQWAEENGGDTAKWRRLENTYRTKRDTAAEDRTATAGVITDVNSKLATAETAFAKTVTEHSTALIADAKDISPDAAAPTPHFSVNAEEMFQVAQRWNTTMVGWSQPALKLDGARDGLQALCSTTLGNAKTADGRVEITGLAVKGGLFRAAGMYERGETERADAFTLSESSFAFDACVGLPPGADPVANGWTPGGRPTPGLSDDLQPFVPCSPDDPGRWMPSPPPVVTQGSGPREIPFNWGNWQSWFPYMMTTQPLKNMNESIDRLVAKHGHTSPQADKVLNSKFFSNKVVNKALDSEHLMRSFTKVGKAGGPALIVLSGAISANYTHAEGHSWEYSVGRAGFSALGGVIVGTGATTVVGLATSWSGPGAVVAGAAAGAAGGYAGSKGGEYAFDFIADRAGWY